MILPENKPTIPESQRQNHIFLVKTLRLFGRIRKELCKRASCAPTGYELPMNILNRFSESRLARRHIPATLLLGTVLLAVNLTARADELQEATQLFKQGQQAPALTKLNNYLANKPRDAQGRFLKGLILTQQGKTADAIKVFSGLTEDYPELPEPYNNLAVLYASQSQYDKAKSALEMAIRTHPSYATAHENLGDIYAKMASQAYDRALQLDSNNQATQTKLAMIQDLFTDKPRGKATAARDSGLFGTKAVATTPAKAEVAPAKVATATVVTAPVAAAPAKTAAAPAKVAAAEKPVAEKPAATDKSHDVLETVNAWAAAWSSQNVKKYLSYYAADFHTPDHETRANWETSRKDRISKPKHIEVSVSNGAVDFADDSHAIVKFHQNYRSSSIKAAGPKTLQMVKSGGSWFILDERAN
jgi:tetratricopeptide (TPR) repeat protein